MKYLFFIIMIPFNLLCIYVILCSMGIVKTPKMECVNYGSFATQRTLKNGYFRNICIEYKEMK